MVANKDIEEIKKKIIPLLRKYGVTKAGIFWSYSRGGQKKNSDVDILVKVDNEFGLIEIIRLKRMLQKAVGRKIDLVEYETIRKELRKQILNDEIRILQWKEITNYILMICQKCSLIFAFLNIPKTRYK